MYIRGRGFGQFGGLGQVSSALLAAPVTTSSFNGDCGSNPCSWLDQLIYPSQECADYYAACDPSSAFNTVTTKGLIVGGSTVVGGTVGAAAGGAVSAAVSNALAPVVDATSIPTWVWVAGAGLGTVLLLPSILRALR